ncbi:MAG: ABC transporter permease [Alphaproteobacteria bacterium]
MATQAEIQAPPGVLEHDADELQQMFVGENVDYYARQFERLAQRGVTINWAAAVFGPLWAASRGLWALFWAGGAVQLLALIAIARGIWGGSEEEANSGTLFLGILVLLAVVAAYGVSANWAYQRQFVRWRIDRTLSAGLNRTYTVASAALVAFVYSLTVYRFSGLSVHENIEQFPTTRLIELNTAKAIDAAVDWLTINFEAAFDSITVAVRTVLNLLELVFVGTPWPVMTVLLLIIAWRVAGWKVAVFTAAALAYLGFFGFWDKAMSTISLVGASVFICFVFGTPLGIWCAKSSRTNAVVKPILDFMQTMPSFVYLIPAVAFFSIGKPPGVLATVIFAMPPMIRLTTLGIQQVPSHVKEAALAFGASPRQLLFKVELPLSVPSIMTGINQTIMMSLSMVVVAALIGAQGLGFDVVRALNHLETGRGILAGIAIVFCAMILDRIVQGSREKDGGPKVG